MKEQVPLKCYKITLIEMYSALSAKTDFSYRPFVGIAVSLGFVMKQFEMVKMKCPLTKR